MERLDDGKIIAFGTVEPRVLDQMRNCMTHPSAVRGVVQADNHVGYHQPVGGIIAYRNHVSPIGVGYDIGCGNLSVRTNLTREEIGGDLPGIMDEIWKRVSFGVGRKNPRPVEHALFDNPLWNRSSSVRQIKDMARAQLGTVGGGNHFVIVSEDEADGSIWVSNHFGSRGFGYTIANGFLNLAEGIGFFEKGRTESEAVPPTLLSLGSELGRDYWDAMTLAGKYAYAGREHVMSQVVEGILGCKRTFEVHNNHNLAWRETHDGEEVVVVRKGATPAFPGQYGFIGGSMCDISAIVRGKDTEAARLALRSTVHGAGRVMSRTKAAGKWRRKRDEKTGRKRWVQIQPGAVTQAMLDDAVRRAGIELRGAGLDESPFVYKRLADVLKANEEVIEICHVLKPLGTAMASAETGPDPYKD